MMCHMGLGHCDLRGGGLSKGAAKETVKEVLAGGNGKEEVQQDQ